MNISVCICTYNRAEMLGDTIASITACHVPDGLKWECLVVDNNSKDHTKSVVEDKINENTDVLIKYISEPQQGLSYARNRAVNEAKGELLLFVDDDVLVDRNWVLEHWYGFKNYDADIIGGPIEILWEGRRPQWLPDNMLPKLCYLDMGDEYILLAPSDDRCLFGANIGFRHSIFQKYGLFDVKLGVSGKGQLVGEELDYQLRVMENNGRVIYIPKAKVQHRVQEWRLKKSSFIKRYYGIGKTQAYMNEAVKASTIFNIPLWSIRSFIGACVTCVISFLKWEDSATFFEKITTVAWRYGQIAGFIDRNK